jgi:hypothetical protein
MYLSHMEFIARRGQELQVKRAAADWATLPLCEADARH